MAISASSTHPNSFSYRLTRYALGLWKRREFAWHLAIGNLRAQNSNTALGLLWYVLNPLLLAGVYFVVFGVIFGAGRGNPTYMAYLVSGMFVFQFTRQAMTGGSSSILQNASLITNLRFPRLLLPISALIETSIGFLVSMAVFFALIPITGIRPGASLAWFLPIFAFQLAWNLGLGSLTARLTVPFRDFGNFLPYLTRMWLYLSPILWEVDRLDGLPDWVEILIKLNPMFYFLSVYRTALLGRDLDVSHLVVAALIALVTCVVGVASFVRFEGRISQHL